MERDGLVCSKGTRKCAEQVSMTGQEFLRWLEQFSMDPLCKSSIDLQAGLMGMEIMDVNSELFKTAIDNVAELNSNSSTRFRRSRRAAESSDC
jgi:hypothetical protein